MPLRIKGNNAIVTRTMTPAWQWQGRLRIDNGNNAIIMMATIAIATKAKMPVHWQQQCHHNEGDDASLTTNNKSNNASLTTAETCNAIVMRETIAIAMTAKMLAHWRQQCHHDKGSDANLTTSNESNNASSTTAEMPAHWQRQQHPCDKSNNCHCNNGKDACALMATTPSQQGQWHQLKDEQWGQLLLELKQSHQ